jgi:peptidoglycan/LPS O-acetylase OafA/YrhL
LNAPAAPRPFFGRIDALRGLGALTVAGYHFSGCCLHGFALLQFDAWPAATSLQHAVARIGLFLLPGHAFVMAFFVISGFVLRVALEHGPQQTHTAIARFAIARLFRFYPIVAVAVFFSAASSPAWSGRTLLTNLLMFDVSMNSHLWAMQLELAMVPVILVLFFLERRWGSAPLAVIAVVTTGLSFAPRWLGWPPLSNNLFAFVIGMALPTLGRRFVAELSSGASAGWLVASATTMLLTAPTMGIYSRYSAVVEVYAAAILVSLAAYRPDTRGLRWLDLRPLRMLGSAAGSCYVLHMAAAPVLLAITTAVVPATWSERAPGLVGGVVVAVWLAAIALPMIAVSRLVEMPGIALGRRVINGLLLDKRELSSTSARPGPVARAA